jgi:hypothetical protein
MNRNETLTSYIGDMIGLERHILEAVDRQSNDETVRSHAQAIVTIEKLKRTVQAHVALLESHAKTIGEMATPTIKEVVTSLAGMAAGFIDKVRTHSVSKDLRDDYTALSLAAIGYTMLHTAALSLDDHPTAELARRHLKDLTPLIVEISEIIPFVVVNELVSEIPITDISVAERALRNTHEAWSRHSMANAA